MEFFFGMFIGAFSVVLVGISYWIVKDKNYHINDYNSGDGKTLEDMVDSEFDPENYFIKPEGTA